MATMTAALHDGKGHMRPTQVARPDPGPLDALVRVRSVGVCGSDLLWYADRREPETAPGGHEVAGEIVEVGESVDESRIGQRVAVENIGHGLACGVCWYCRMGQFRQCQDMADIRGGGFAEYIVRRAAGCYPLPQTMSWDEAALVEPLAVSVHAMRRGSLVGGETVAVIGAGNIGLTAVAAARALGAGRVIASARHPQQAAMATQLGADEATADHGAALREAAEEATAGRGADIAVETVGGHSGDTIVQGIDVTRVQGRLVVLGGFHEPFAIDWLQPLLKEQSIIFSSCYSVLDGRHDYEIAIDLMASGRVDLKPMVTHTFPLDDIQDAFNTAYDKATGSIKVQIHA